MASWLYRRCAAIFGVLVAAMCLPAACGASTDDGMDEPLPNGREYTSELIALAAKADAGDVPSQLKLADYYFRQSDHTNALIWFKRAGEQGAVEAQLAVASCYLAGRGTMRNPTEAATWLRMAADKISPQKTNASTLVAAVAVQSGHPKLEPIASAPSAIPQEPIFLPRFGRITNLEPVKPSFQKPVAALKRHSL